MGPFSPIYWALTTLKEPIRPMTRLKILFCAFFLLAFLPFAAWADTPKEVAQAEAYFASLKTAQARFVQTSADGHQERGVFYISRPGKLRFQYDAPNGDFVVADGLFIYFYDSRMKQQSNAPISQTLADFLLRKTIKLSGDLKVEKIMRTAGIVQIFVREKEQPESGTLVLGFIDNGKGGLDLKKWRIVDSLGNITETELFNVQTGVKFKDSKLFAYQDPNPKGLNR